MLARGLPSARPVLRSPHRQPRIRRQPATYMRFPPPPNPRSQQGQQPITRLYQSAKFRKLAYTAVLGGTTFYLYNLETVPVTNRRRFNFINPSVETAIAKQAYAEVRAQYYWTTLPPSHPTVRYVRRVMERLVPVCGLQDLEWEVFVVADDRVRNAFVIPGGKVFVFTGILPICGDEDGLAAVLSHEIAHTVAHHTAERVSKSFIALAGLLLLSVSSNVDPALFGDLVDLVFLRPGSRKQEAEADYIGLMMMAEACFDPRKAVTLWQRMERAQEFEPPQFLSTHPSHKTRAQKITEWMPEALQKFENSDCEGRTLDYAEAFRRAFGNVRW